MTISEVIKECKKALAIADRNDEQYIDLLITIIKALEQAPCEDAVSRQAVLDLATTIWTDDYIDNQIMDVVDVDDVKALPSVTPQYTEAEIQKMQELEQAEIQKAYELGKAEQPCEDAISRREAIKKFTYNHKGERIPDYDCDNFPTQIDIKTVKEILRDLPPVTPQPKTGHWSRKTKVDAYDIAGAKTWGIKCQCDRCDFTTIVVEDFGYYNYCPNCGAKMAESEDK